MGASGLTVVLKSELYPGICLMSDGQIHYFQKYERYGKVSELKYVKHAKPPNDFSNDIAGMPMFYPTIPLLNRLNFAWKCQMQKCNRIGAPSIAISVKDPIVVTDENGNPIPGKRNDWEYCNIILQNWGTNNAFAHQDNITIIPLDVKESDSAMETIHELAKLIVNQWSPTEQISTDGNAKLGGSQEAATTLLINFIVGFHRHISKVFTSIVQDILRYNNYKGYTVYLRFPKPEFRNSEIDIERAKVGFETAALSANELRELLGYEPESEEDLEDIREWNVAVKQAGKVPKDLNGEILNNKVEEDTEEDATPEVKVPEEDESTSQEVSA
jgi:hypothetical protein